MDAHILINFFHIFFVVPLFLFVAFSRDDTPSQIYTFLLYLGIFIIAFHAYKAVKRYMAGSPHLWVSIFHVLIIGPLVTWIGFKAKNTGRPVYEMLALAAFGALGYHIYQLIISMNILTDIDE